MQIGLIDVDGHNFPNLALMKISAYHKSKGDEVEWWFGDMKHYDRIYKSKVFSDSYTADNYHPVNCDELIEGGTGYAIHTVNGREIFDKSKHNDLPNEIEHIMPDYSMYGITDTAYGYLTRGCPRGCDFCIVKDKEQRCSVKVADVDEFWNGQKKIVLLDPNILACKDAPDLLRQLRDTNRRIDFTQGLDIRMMTDEYAEELSQIKIDKIHFAWDRIEDAAVIKPKFEAFRKASTINNHNLVVYVLVGDRERKILDSDLERIYWLRDNGFAPFVMIYDKKNLPPHHEFLRLQQWCNNPFVFWKCKDFKDYDWRLKSGVRKSAR